MSATETTSRLGLIGESVRRTDGTPTWYAPKWMALWGMVLFMLAVRLIIGLASTYAPQNVHGADLGIVLFSVTVTAAHIFALKMAQKAN